MNAEAQYAAQLKAERAFSRFIPYSSHISDHVLMTKDGDFVATWRLEGIPHETSDQGDVQDYLDRLNMLYRSIGSSQISIWSHQIHRHITDRLVADFTTDFAKSFDDAYHDALQQNAMMENGLYFTLVYRPYTNKTEKLFKKAQRDHDGMRHFIDSQVSKVEELANQIESSLRHYGTERLGVYKDQHDVRYSSALEFLNFLLSGYWQKVRVPDMPLYDYLGTSWIFCGTETIELRAPDHTRYLRGIDFKEYNSSTQAGILNALSYAEYDFVATHSFSCMSKREGKSFLLKQQKLLVNSDEGSENQADQIVDAIQGLENGEFVMGNYHFSMLVSADTMVGAIEASSEALATIQDMGFLAALISTATEAAFYAQLPANWFYRPRIAGITSRNFCGLSSFHNFSSGKRDHNPWGQALTMMQTPAGQPYYLNFHDSPMGEDSFDRKYLGNVRVIGKSGSGKTALLSALVTQSMKYAADSPTGFCLVFFDKDRGAELTIRANNGKYFTFKDGQPSGMNPFQLENTETNILFLNRFITKLATTGGQTISTLDSTNIDKAIRTVMTMEKYLRSITVFCQNITEGVTREERDNSIVKRLAKWCEGGQYGWVFDNPEDKIDFTVSNVFGFDGTAFLDNKDTCSPISMYLLHRIESVIDGRRFIYLMDECQAWVPDDTFGEFADNKQLTIRKQNGLGVFATQMPSKLLNSKVAASLVQQVATEIYLPNPKADYDEYTNGFKVTDAEFQIIKKLDEESRMFLVKQAHSSALVRFDLGGMDDHLAILSGSSDNIELLDEILSEVGDNPKDWLPVFHERRKARFTKK